MISMTKSCVAGVVVGAMFFAGVAASEVKTANFASAPAGAASDLLVPVDLEKLGNAPLAGAGVNLGDGLALAEGSMPTGMVTVGGMPFLCGPKGMDVSTSMAGIKEIFRAKFGYLHDGARAQSGRLVAAVPADQYAALHVIAFSRALKGAVPRMTARIGVFGRSDGALVDSRVAVPDILGKDEAPNVVERIPVKLAGGKSGYLYHLRIPLAQSGNLRDFIGPNYGFALEFTRDVNPRQNQPDPNEFIEVPMGAPSAVVVLAATLERSPVIVAPTADEPGNVFYDTQKPAFKVKIQNRANRSVKGQAVAKCAGPGTPDEFGLDRKEWTVKSPYEVKHGESTEVRLDVTPAGNRRGWFECTVAVDVDGIPAQERLTSFAVLAPDERKDFDDSPFGVWEFWVPHGSAPYTTIAALLKKAGLRWTYGGAPSKTGDRFGKDFTAADFKELREKYGVRLTMIVLPESYQRKGGWFDEKAFQEKVVPELKGARERGHDNAFKVMHEARSSNELLRRLNEVLGGMPYGWPAAEKAQVDQQFENVKKYCAAIKKADPTAKVLLISDYPIVAIEFMKRGFPKELFDMFGLESANFMREPERHPDWLCLLGTTESMRRAQKQYGYDKPIWMTESLYHSTNPGNLTLHRQGVLYVREFALALASGVQKLAATGMLRDSSDDYRWSHWGCAGFCNAGQEANPKPSYAMVAWLTQILDQAKPVGFMKSDSTSLHVLDFKKKNGGHVYPIWVVRGLQKVELKTRNGKPVVHDVYGNVVDTTVKDGIVVITASETPLYLAGAEIESVASREPVEIQRDPGEIVLEFDDAKQMAVVAKTSKTMEGNWDYPRIKGAFKTDFVQEDGVSALKVELQPDGDKRTLFQRYVEFELAKPITLSGRPFAFTARIKGNGGWGKVMFELVDAKGRVWTSCGNQFPGCCNTGDNKGESFVSFDGWQTMRIPVVGQYAGADQFARWLEAGDWWPDNAPERVELDTQGAKYDADMAEYKKKFVEFERAQKDFEAKQKAGDTNAKAPQKPGEPRKPDLRFNGVAPVDYPVKLTKVIVAMPPAILYVNGEIPVAKPVIYIDRLGVEQPPVGM